MKATHFISILLVCTALVATFTEGSLISRIFGEKKPEVKHRYSINQELVDAKNLAYQKYVESQKGISDMSHKAWDKAYDMYEATWNAYYLAKEKIYYTLYRTIDEARKDYDEAKTAVKQATLKITDFLKGYKDKAEDWISDKFMSGLNNAEYAASEARRKYSKARDTLAGLYDDAYEEALEDYNAAAEYLSDTTERLKNYATRTADKNYEKNKARLEQARDKAREKYKQAKTAYTDLKAKIDEFNTNVSTELTEDTEALKERAKWTSDWLNSYKDNAKNKAERDYHILVVKIKRLSDQAAANLAEAEETMKTLKDRASKFTTDAIETCKQKYQALKDEL